MFPQSGRYCDAPSGEGAYKISQLLAETLYFCFSPNPSMGLKAHQYDCRKHTGD